jgi:hypothetical protein
MRVSEGVKCIPYGRKEQVVIHPLVVQTNCIELVRNCEDNMIVLNGQGVLHQVVNPEGLFGSLAFRTVPVATTVIAIAHHTAAIAYLLVSAKS